MRELIETSCDSLGMLQKDLNSIKSDIFTLNDNIMKEHEEHCSHDHDSEGSIEVINSANEILFHNKSANATPMSVEKSKFHGKHKNNDNMKKIVSL